MTDRVEQFKADIAGMGLKDPAAARDRRMLRLGVLLLIAGPVVGIVAYSLSNGTDNALAQRDAIVLAVTGVAVSVVGGAVFLRYSLAHFLRFWLARLTWEQGVQTDRVVAAVEQTGLEVAPEPQLVAPRQAR